MPFIRIPDGSEYLFNTRMCESSKVLSKVNLNSIFFLNCDRSIIVLLIRYLDKDHINTNKQWYKNYIDSFDDRSMMSMRYVAQILEIDDLCYLINTK
jgi:hypothetical protein